MKWYIVLSTAIFLSNLLLAQPKKQIEKAKDCSVCHEEIFTQWQSSMHARSTADQDVLYSKMMAWAIKDTKGKARKLCRKCHYPFTMSDSLAGMQEAYRDRGVDCIYCHSLDQLDQPPRFSRTKYSGNENNRSDYHDIQERRHFKNSQLCLKCHDALVNPNRVQICITGMEYSEFAGRKKSCNDCHMPKVDIKTSAVSGEAETAAHRFDGPHNPEFLKGSLKLRYRIQQDSVTITVDNGKTPHAYPTGSPLRQVIVKVEGFDQQGRKQYENWTDNPLKQAPEALFVRLFSGKDGSFPVPPWRAVQVERDTRLKPGEKREITYPVQQNINRFKVSLFFRLAPPAILNRLDIDDPYLNKAHLIRQMKFKI